MTILSALAVHRPFYISINIGKDSLGSRVRVKIRVSFLSRPIPESIPECAECILVTLRSAVLKLELTVLEVQFQFEAQFYN